MGMPRDLVLVRHGLSEGNLATEAAKNGDESFYTDAFMTTPGHQWRLAPLGSAQARTTGAWITENIADRFDRYYTSPYVRTRETAAHMGLADASWRMNRAIRERDWGDIGSLPRSEFETRPEYRLNAWLKRNDPLYWAPLGGESIAHVAEDRIRNVCSTLHRECDGDKVICVTHGEAMWAFRLVLERFDDETFAALDADKSEKIHNCEALHYTRVNPVTGELAPRLTWLRRAYPDVSPDSTTVMVCTDWAEIVFPTYTNVELLASISHVPYLFS